MNPDRLLPLRVLRVLRGLSLLCLAGGACGALAQTATSLNEGLRLEHHATTGVSTAYWWGRAGNTYFLQHSEDLQSWIYFPELKPGADAILGENFTTTASKSFIRLRISDLPTSDPFNADFDHDGVSNSDELAQGTDPLASNDTDTDGLSDDWEIKHFGNFNHEPEADDDQDGMSNSAEQAAGTDPNDDDSDNDGTKDGNDAYPKDDRRQENIPEQTYALIDLGEGAMPATAQLDLIALGADDRVAFSWWEGSTYKVAKWKDGALVEPAKETALTLSDPDHYFDITFDPAYHTQTHLNSNGTVSRSDRGYVGLWPYGTTEAKQRANLDSDTNDGDYWGGQLLDNDVLVWMGWEYSFGIWKTALGSPAVEKIFGPLPGNHRYVSFDSNSTQGLIGVTRYSLHSEEVSVLDLSGNQTVIASSAGDQYPGPNLGQITVINDSRDFILSGSDQGPSLYYKAGVKVGPLKSLLPTLYHAQTRYGSDPATFEAFMIGLSNSGQLLLSMENLEGPDRGAWVPRTFISDKLIDPTNPNTHQRTLKVAKFPENYQVELKGGPQGMTEDGGLLAALATKTAEADGTPIPTAQQTARPAVGVKVDFQELTPSSGFDGESQPHWLMVPQNGANYAKALTPASAVTSFSFHIKPDASHEVVSPASTQTSPQTITVSGVTVGATSQVAVGMGPAVGLGGELKISVKKYQPLTVAIHKVTQRYPRDHYMPLSPNEGVANVVCVKPKPNASVVGATTPGGDDQPRSDGSIDTGANGVCQTNANTQYDQQVIPNGQGVHKDIAAEHVPTEAALQASLNQIFGLQTNTYFTVTRDDFVADYDHDKNKLLDVKTAPNSTGPEEDALQAHATAGVDFNIYYVKDFEKVTPTGGVSRAAAGTTKVNLQTTYISDEASNMMYASCHEVGHLLGIAGHADEPYLIDGHKNPTYLNGIDAGKRLMYHQEQGNSFPTLLVKPEWDIVNQRR